MLKTFTGGVHPHDYKELSKGAAIRRLDPPAEVVVALSQHIGAPAQAVVQKGDEVKKGQLIGEAGGFVSAPVHAPVSGKVLKLDTCPHPVGMKVGAVVIENDGADEWIEGCDRERDYSSLSPKEIKEAIMAAGIVGMGGATFPTHVKLSPPPEKPIEYAILNGAECEPFLTSDYRLMKEKPDGVYEGFKIIMRALGAKKGIIAIESNKPDAFATMQKKAAGDSDITVELLKVKYPQGAEKTLIKTVLDREVPSGGLPMDVGVVVQNVGTAFAVFEALAYNRPLIERVVTVTGDRVRKPSNFLAPIGTPIQALLDAAETSEKFNKVILGGPMMGIAQYTTGLPVMKGTSGVLVTGAKDTGAWRSCIRCGRCVEVCPMQLVPSQISVYAEANDFAALKEWDVLDCVECGCCTYICPARRPIVHFVKHGKAELARMRAEEKKQQEAEKQKAAAAP